MADNTEFELIAPERVVTASPVQMVVVPCTEGDIGVLPGHAPLVATVRPGVIDVHENGRVKERVFVSGGFCEVTPGRCTVLAEEALPVSDIDRGAAERRLADAKAALDAAADEGARKMAAAKVRTAEALVAAAGSR